MSRKQKRSRAGLRISLRPDHRGFLEVRKDLSQRAVAATFAPENVGTEVLASLVVGQYV